MYTTGILLIFIAFFLMYNTSKKSRWADKSDLAGSLEKKQTVSKLLSALLTLIAGSVFVYANGTASGIFTLIVVLMAMASLQVLLFPFRYLSLKHVVGLFLFFVTLEHLIF